jgi:hypothetical protein
MRRALKDFAGERQRSDDPPVWNSLLYQRVRPLFVKIVFAFPQTDTGQIERDKQRGERTLHLIVPHERQGRRSDRNSKRGWFRKRGEEVRCQWNQQPLRSGNAEHPLGKWTAQLSQEEMRQGFGILAGHSNIAPANSKSGPS